MSNHAPDRNLALELVRVTEAAAMGAGRWIGRGDKIAADQAAVDAMRAMLDTVDDGRRRRDRRGREGRGADALQRRAGRRTASGPEVDVAVDPLDGTRLTALGQPNAIAVIAVAERGSMFFPGAAVYMEKIAVGADAVDAIDINATPTENVQAVAEGEGRGASPTSRVVVLERDRHDELIGELREAGARVNLIRDGDVAPAIAAARPETGVDLLLGIGGTPEGVISAAALKCVGGGIQGKLWPRNDDERQALLDAGYDLDRVLTDRRPRRGRRRLRRRDRRHDRRPAARRALRHRRRGHRFDRHALALGHGAPDRGAPPVEQAAATSPVGSTDGRRPPGLQFRRRYAAQGGLTMAVATHEGIEQIEELLGDEAESLLGPHVSRRSTRTLLHLPGPDFVDRVVALNDRSNQVLRNLQSMFAHGRLAGTGYLSILPVDQGIEHSAGASFAPNPAYFDPEKIVELAHRGRLQRGRLDDRRARRGRRGAGRTRSRSSSSSTTTSC